MKKFILALSLTISTFATTYTAKSIPTISSYNSDYKFLETLDLEVISLDRVRNILEINVNGEVKKVSLKLLTERFEYHDVYATYQANIQFDTLATGGGCEEAESVSYVVKLSHEEPLYSSHQKWTTIDEVYAVHSYNWDICHGSDEVTKIDYTK